MRKSDKKSADDVESRRARDPEADKIAQLGKNPLIWEVVSRSRGYFNVDLRSLSSGIIDKGIIGRPDLVNEIALDFRPWSYGKERSTITRQLRYLKEFFSFLTEHQKACRENIQKISQLNAVHGNAFRGWVLQNLRSELRDRDKCLRSVEKWLNLACLRNGLCPLIWPSIEAGNGPLPHKDVNLSAVKSVYSFCKRVHDESLKNQTDGERILASGSAPKLNENFHDFSLYCRSLLRNRISAGSVMDPIEAQRLRDKCRFTFGISLSDFYILYAPSIRETLSAYMLVSLHTGWLDAMLAIDVVDSEFRECEDWFVDRPHDNNKPSNRLQSVILLAQSGHEGSKHAASVGIGAVRPKTGRLVSALSNKSSRYHPYQVIRSQVNRTRFLRSLLRQLREQIITDQLTSKTQKQALFEIERKLRSPWIYYNPKGVGHRAVGLINRGDPVAAQFRRAILPGACDYLSRRGKTNLIPSVQSLVPSDVRDGFAAFLYDHTGGNIFVVQHSLNHSGASTTRHYLRQKRQIRERFLAYRQMCEQLFNEVRTGADVDPTALRLACSELGISDADRKHLSEFRSRFNMGCTSPSNPPSSIAPNHISGTLCATQRCIMCKHARLTAEALVPLARRYAELETLSRVIPVQRFLTSSFEVERQAIEIVREETYPELRSRFDHEVEMHIASLRSGEAALFDEMPLGDLPAMLRSDETAEDLN